MVQSRGPGPGAYVLPTTIGYDNHDLRKNRRPQYSLGMRLPDNTKSIGPGPGAYVFDKATKFGVEHPPAYSFGTKADIDTRKLGPGPAAYNIREFQNFGKKTPPAYSFGVKHIDYANLGTRIPGPNAYKFSLSAFKPSAPAYSMRARTYYEAKNISPGPTYSVPNLNLILKKSPAFSLAGPHITLKPSTNIPGSNAYDVSGYKPGKVNPAFSFGIRHSPEEYTLILPCDN